MNVKSENEQKKNSIYQQLLTAVIQLKLCIKALWKIPLSIIITAFTKKKRASTFYIASKKCLIAMT